MTLGTIDAVLVQQVLITGQVVDTLTERPVLSPPLVELFYQTPAGEPPRRYPLLARLYPGDLFVFSGAPAFVFPRLAAGGTLDLRLTVSASNYQTWSVDFSLSPTDLALTEQPRQVEGRTVSVAVLAAPLFQQQINLLPQPVHLNGQVVNANEPDTPIQNAEVRVIGPETRGPVNTDADGFFILHNMPVALEIRVRVDRSGFTTLETPIALDYRQPVNRQIFALNS